MAGAAQVERIEKGLEISEISIADVRPLTGMSSEEVKEWTGGNLDAESGRITFGRREEETVIDLTAKTLTLPAWREGVYTPEVFDIRRAVVVSAEKIDPEGRHHQQLTLVLPTQMVASMKGEVIPAVDFEEGRLLGLTFYYSRYLATNPINPYHNAIARASRIADSLMVS